MELDLANTSNTTRGIASAWILDHLSDRWKLIQNVLGVAALIVFLLSFFVWSWLQPPMIFVATLIGISWLGGVVTRWIAMRLVRLIAAPARFGEYEDEVAEALNEADLPTAPLAAIRFVWRLRRGVTVERDRLIELTRRVDQIVERGARPQEAPPPPGRGGPEAGG